MAVQLKFHLGVFFLLFLIRINYMQGWNNQ